jgi:hypothetical protein
MLVDAAAMGKNYLIRVPASSMGILKNAHGRIK